MTDGIRGRDPGCLTLEEGAATAREKDDKDGYLVDHGGEKEKCIKKQKENDCQRGFNTLRRLCGSRLS